MTKQSQYGENPFTPGAGRKPPYLAGRDKVLADWRGNQLESGRFENPEIMMYGPRGTGKTAILAEFEIAARDFNCHLVRENAPVLNRGQDAMADLLLSQFEQASQLDTETTHAEVRGGLSVPGIADAGGATAHSRTVKHRDLAATRSLTARLRDLVKRKPLVLLLDEAHAIRNQAASEALGALVNAVQQLVSEDLPVCLVLAGTPGLPQTLVDTLSSFDERFAEIGIGLLDAEAAKASIEKPLADRVWLKAEPASRLGIEPDALDAVVQDSGGYPYFLQLWGRELWKHAISRGADALTLADVRAVRQAVDALRLTNYHRRSEEIDFNSDLLVSANAIAEAFQQYHGDGDASRIEQPAIINVVEQVLAPDYPDRRQRDTATQRCVKELARVGFVWRPPGTPYMEPGIPSFLNYTQELYAKRRGHRQAARRNLDSTP